jgi:hypothetical protein
MAQEYEKTIRFAGIGLEIPAITAKSKKRLEKRAESEKLAAVLSKKRKAAKKAASATAKANRPSLLDRLEKTPK